MSSEHRRQGSPSFKTALVSENDGLLPNNINSRTYSGDEFASSSSLERLRKGNFGYRYTGSPIRPSFFVNLREKSGKPIGQAQPELKTVNRSLSADNVTPNILRHVADAKDSCRKGLYGNLPFFATFGMQQKENSLQSMLSMIRLRSFESISAAQQDARSSSASLEDEEIIITLPLTAAVLLAVSLQFLVGYSIVIVNVLYKDIFHSILPSTASPPTSFTNRILSAAMDSGWIHTVASSLVSVPSRTLSENLSAPPSSVTTVSVSSLLLLGGIMSVFALGAVLGIAFTGTIAHKHGRRSALRVISWVFLLGAVLCAFSWDNLFVFAIGRLLSGYASGASMIIVPLYLGEVAPPTMRGLFGTYLLLAKVTGLFCSAVFSYYFSRTPLWRVPMTIMIFPSILLVLLSHWFILESPRWELKRYPTGSEGKSIIKKLRGYRNDAEIQKEVDMYLYALSKHHTNFGSAHSWSAIRGVVNIPELGWFVVLLCALHSIRQLCGAYVLYTYSTYILENHTCIFANTTDALYDIHYDDIISPQILTILFFFSILVSSLTSVYFVSILGRRTLLLISMLGMIISATIITFSFLHYIPYYSIPICLIFYGFCFKIGLGPILWLLIAEAFESKYVSTMTMISYLINYSVFFLLILFFPLANHYFKNYIFLLNILCLFIGIIITYFFLPETQGRTLEEIRELLSLDDADFQKAVMVLEAVEIDDFTA